MTSSFYQRLTLDIQRQIDRCCDNFERAWLAGEQPRIEDVVHEVFEDDFSGHRSSGDNVFGDNVFGNNVFGNNVSGNNVSGNERIAALVELIGVEVELRRRVGQQPALSEYRQRFPAFAFLLDELDCFASSGLPAASQGASKESTLADGHDSAAASTERSIGSYRLLEKIGQGGMGEVYRVAHRLIDCQRALKTLRPKLARHPEAVARFLLEAETSVRHLHHPNLVTVYDVSCEGETVYLVMELVDGVDLARLVDAEGPLAATRAARLIEQAAVGLQHAHDLGFVHRDIKPHNIMVTPEGQVKLLDLGLVRVLESPELAPPTAAGSQAFTEPPTTTEESPAVSRVDYQRTLTVFHSRMTDDRALLGTLPFMAPEQAANAREADFCCDIYSLGCTLYFLLSGRVPFTGSSVEEILRKHLAADYPRLEQLRPDLPEALVQIVDRMMHRDRQPRYSTAKQVREALNGWLGGRPERIRVRDTDQLRRGLVELGLISEDDWKTAVVSAYRPPSTGWTGDRTNRRPRQAESTLTDSGDETLHPAIILQKLQELQRSRGGQKYGLSEFQVRTILNENGDLLRLPHHVLLDQIGGGWKGELCKARSLRRNRTEVVRVFTIQSLIGLGSDLEERARRFAEFMNRVQSVSHSVLCPIVECGDYRHRLRGDCVYVASEFIEGRSLRDRLARRNEADREPVTLGWVAEQWEAVARGLAAAHARGILHLDITAYSLHLDRLDRLRLTDLGIASLIREMPEPQPEQPPAAAARSAWRSRRPEAPKPRAAALTDTAASMTIASPATLGAPEVQAPELLRDPRAVSPAADIYSLGCCLFYALAGQYPYSNDPSTASVFGHLTQSPFHSDAAHRIPATFRPLVDQMLQKNPADRPHGAAEVAEHLAALRSSSRFPHEQPVGVQQAVPDKQISDSWLRRFWPWRRA